MGAYLPIGCAEQVRSSAGSAGQCSFLRKFL